MDNGAQILYLPQAGVRGAFTSAEVGKDALEAALKDFYVFWEAGRWADAYHTDVSIQYAAAGNEGLRYRQLGDFRQALNWFGRGLRCWQVSGLIRGQRVAAEDVWQRSRFDCEISLTYRLMGDTRTCRSRLTRDIMTLGANDDHGGKDGPGEHLVAWAQVMLHLGNLEHHEGHLQEALACYSKVQTVLHYRSDDPNVPGLMTQALLYATYVYLAQGDRDNSRRAAEATLDYAERHGQTTDAIAAGGILGILTTAG